MANSSKKVRKVVIPAAGFGTRFLPATKAQPKEMLPIVDKPIIQYVVEQAVEAGIEEIIIVTGWHKRAIEDHFDKHFELEARLEKDGKSQQLEEIRKISELGQFFFLCPKKNPAGKVLGVCGEKKCGGCKTNPASLWRGVFFGHKKKNLPSSEI